MTIVIGAGALRTILDAEFPSGYAGRVETVIPLPHREILMLDSLINLPAAIPSLWRSLHAGKKRRTATSRNCFAMVENLEDRQLLSAANSVVEHGGVPRIINGTTTTSFPAVGLATFTPTSGTAVQSSGTLITGTTLQPNQWVLTTASASKGLTTAGGTATIVLGGNTYTVDSITIYPKYIAGSIDYRQDIAIWHLSTAVTGVTPLAVSLTPLAASSTATIVGFGGVGTGTTGSDGTIGTKQTGTTKIERVSASQLIWKVDGNLTTDAAPAPNDIGAPVLKLVGSTYQVYGLSTYLSTTTGKKGTTAYSTRTDFYAGWIDNVMGRAHPTTTATDDYINTADTVGTTNRKFTLTTSAPSSSVTGKFQDYGDVDVFKVVTAANGYISFSLINASPSSSLLDVKLELLGSNGTTVLMTVDDNSSTNLNAEFATYLDAGNYYVRVSTYANSQKGSYTLSVKANYDNVSDLMTGAKALTPNSIGSIASDIYINTTSDVDWYKFKANKSGKFQFDFTHSNPANFDPVIDVYTSAGVLLAHNDDIGGTGPNVLDARVVVNGIVSGQTYYIKVSGYVSGITGLGSTGFGKLAGKKIG